MQRGMVCFPTWGKYLGIVNTDLIFVILLSVTKNHSKLILQIPEAEQIGENQLGFWNIFFLRPKACSGASPGGSLYPAAALTLLAVYGWDPQTPDGGPSSCSGVPHRASPRHLSNSWLMGLRHSTAQADVLNNIFVMFITFIATFQTFLLGYLEAVQPAGPCISPPVPRHAAATLNALSMGICVNNLCMVLMLIKLT